MSDQAFNDWYDRYFDEAIEKYAGLDTTNPKGIAQDAWDAAIEADRKRRFESGEALQRYKDCEGDKESDPIERLRFYCSLAMSGQDWLDVEPFFDDLIADRRRRGKPTAAEISDVIREITGCPDIKNGEDSLVVALGILFHRCATTQSSEPDYKQLFEQMCERCDALDAKLAEYSEREPVGYIMPTAIKQLKAGGNAIVGGVSQGCDVPIYTAPQPAEPVVPSVIDLIADDAYAATFQSIGQYRKALLARYGNQTQEQP